MPLLYARTTVRLLFFRSQAQSLQRSAGRWIVAARSVFQEQLRGTSGNTDGRHIRFILFHGQPDVDGIHGSMNGWFDSQMGRRAVERRHTGAAPEEEPGQ